MLREITLCETFEILTGEDIELMNKIYFKHMDEYKRLVDYKWIFGEKRTASFNNFTHTQFYIEGDK